MSLLAQITDESRARGLEFVVIGALAVNVHGLIRDTADLDLLVQQEKREAWLKLLAEFQYTVASERPAFCQLDPPAKGAWPVDLMFVREPTFRQMFTAALEVEMFDCKVRVPCIDHLIALKLHALKHGPASRFMKDYLDVEGLLRVNKLDPRQPRIRELFLKYGTSELYGKICRSINP